MVLKASKLSFTSCNPKYDLCQALFAGFYRIAVNHLRAGGNHGVVDKLIGEILIYSEMWTTNSLTLADL